jgi:uncharacterized cupin superfamily protein
MTNAIDRHVTPLFASFAAEAKLNATKEPLGYSATKLTIPEGEKEACHHLWASPEGTADLHIWLAQPGDYDVDGRDRPNFFEVTAIMVGSCTVAEVGYEPFIMNPGDTYIMRPSWTGRWTVHEYVEKSFLWLYV